MAGFNKRPQASVPLIAKILAAAIAIVLTALVLVLIIYFSGDNKPPENDTTTSFFTETTETEKSSVSTTTYPLDVVPTTEYITVVSETTVTTTKQTTRANTSETTTTTTTAPETYETTAETTVAEESTAETTAPIPTNDTYDKSWFANDLFIGDSIYTGLYLYDYFPNDQVFAKIGLNPQSARITRINGYSAIKRASEKKPVHIFIMLGTNGLAYMSPSFMADEMKSLVDELKEASPDSAVYVVSIPPVTKVHEQAGQETMAMVDKYNGLLKDMCESCDATYLDLCGQLLDDSGYFSSLYAEADGMHFLGAAYKRMLAYFYMETQ